MPASFHRRLDMDIQSFCSEIKKLYNAWIIYHAGPDQVEIDFSLVNQNIMLIYDGEQIRNTDFDDMILIIEDDIWRATNRKRR